MDPTIVDTVMPSVLAAVGTYGSAVLTQAEDAAADETVRLGQRLLARFRRDEAARPRVDAAVADLAEALDDDDFRSALRAQIKKILASDPELAGDIRALLPGGAAMTAAGDRSVVVGTNFGIVSTGDNARIRG